MTRKSDTRLLHRGLRGLVAAALLAVVSVAPHVAAAGNATVSREPVYAGALATFGDCPDVDAPLPAGTDCVENYVLLVRNIQTSEGGSVAPRDARWNFYAQSVRVESPAGEVVGGDPTVTLLRWGGGEVVGTVSVDQVHLQVAEARVALPMSDGSTMNFAASWHAISDRVLFGNDGPSTGAPHHVVSKCVTSVAIGHETFTTASMTGTLDGAPVHSYTAVPSARILSSDYRYIDVQHGHGCP